MQDLNGGLGRGDGAFGGLPVGAGKSDLFGPFGLSLKRFRLIGDGGRCRAADQRAHAHVHESKKAAPKTKATARKAPAKKAPEFSLKNSAEKAVNIYLGVIGMGYDRVQENMDSVRKDNEKRMKDLEKRGAKLRKELRTNIDRLEAPEFDEVVDDVKEQFNKLQDQLEDVVENMKEKLTPAKAA